MTDFISWFKYTFPALIPLFMIAIAVTIWVIKHDFTKNKRRP